MGICLSRNHKNGDKLSMDVEQENNVKSAKQQSCSAQNNVPPRMFTGPNLAESASSVEETADSCNKARVFALEELVAVTKSFMNESCIGKGGFGTVYKGRLEGTGQIVAVKKLDTESLQGDKEFLVEILMLSLLRHPNLVTMIGYCAEGDQRLLVYEYMPLGSLEHHLHGLQPNQQSLDWNTRLMIAYGAAKGLHYLHNEADPPVIFRDLKSANILLDQNFQPKLSDFGLAKFGPGEGQTHVTTRVMGTQGYCAPEYASSGKLTMKSDIFSFGVVLLELITGRRALDCRHGQIRHLVEWARPLMRERDRRKCLQMVDPQLQGQWSARTMKMTIQVASTCLGEDPGLRPTVAEILQALDYLVSRQNSRREICNGANPGRQKDEDSPKETRRILMKQEREEATADAKQWRETWREKRRVSARSSPEELH